MPGSLGNVLKTRCQKVQEMLILVILKLYLLRGYAAKNLQKRAPWVSSDWLHIFLINRYGQNMITPKKFRLQSSGSQNKGIPKIGYISLVVKSQNIKTLISWLILIEFSQKKLKWSIFLALSNDLTFIQFFL